MIDDQKNTQLDQLRAMIFGTPLTSTPDSDYGSIVAIDCEMVGVGPILGHRYQNGKRVANYASALARVSIVDFYGHQVLDTFVKPDQKVSDYRTHVSGIRPQDLQGGNVVSLSMAKTMVSKALRDRVVVGHAVHNDLRVCSTLYFPLRRPGALYSWCPKSQYIRLSIGTVITLCF